MQQPVEQGHPQNAQVEPGCPVSDVVEIVLDALAQRGVAAPAVDLGPAGDAGFDAVAGVVAGNGFAELLDENGTFGTWPNQAHVAAQYVDELGQLIETGLAEECHQTRTARIGLLRPE